MGDLKKYKKYNELIAPLSWPENPYPSRHERLLSMLKSGVPALQVDASMDIFKNKNYSESLLTVLKQEVEKNYLRSLSKDEIDAIAWMCKSLASSQVAQYQAFIEVVATRAKEKKLKKYANGYYKTYYQ